MKKLLALFKRKSKKDDNEIVFKIVVGSDGSPLFDYKFTPEQVTIFARLVFNLNKGVYLKEQLNTMRIKHPEHYKEFVKSFRDTSESYINLSEVFQQLEQNEDESPVICPTQVFPMFAPPNE